MIRKTHEWPVKPQTHTCETPTRKTWGRGLTGTGTGWPGIPQGYPWYSLSMALLYLNLSVDISIYLASL